MIKIKLRFAASLYTIYGTPVSNILKDIEIIKCNFIKKIHIVSFGRVGYLKIVHSPKFLNYYQIMTMHDNATYFSLETLYELHMVYLKKTDMTPYKLLKLYDLTDELHNNMRVRLIHIIEEEKIIENNKNNNI